MRADQFEGNAADFRERVIWVIRNFVGTPPRYKVLEDRFGISARKWQNVCNLAQQPSIEMVAALSSAYPFFLSWMVTGEAKTVLQLDPSNRDWMRSLLSALEVDKPAWTDALNRYADSICLDQGIGADQDDTSASSPEAQKHLSNTLSVAPPKRKKNGDHKN